MFKIGDMSKIQENVQKALKKQTDAADKRKADRVKEVELADTDTVSGRIKKAVGVEGLEDKKMQDIIKGAQFGEAVIGEGLGRLQDDPEIQAMKKQVEELSKGYKSEEMLAMQEKGIEGIQGATQAQSRAMQAQLARSGVKGQAAGAQLGQIALGGIEARGNLERDLMIAQRGAQMEGTRFHAQSLGELKAFDIAQAAKEKDIALQAGLGFAQLGSTERAAAAATAAQVQAAKASKQSSCFLTGTKIEMEDGSLKKIEDIKLADKLKSGGVVYGTSQSLVSEIYLYDGVFVTGNHAVREEGEWIRVKSSKNADLHEGVYSVYNLSNENHRIITENGIIFADYDETDFCSEISDSESLEVLNGESSKLLERRRRL